VRIADSELGIIFKPYIQPRMKGMGLDRPRTDAPGWNTSILASTAGLDVPHCLLVPIVDCILLSVIIFEK
jgi:hypothetical protein